MSIENDNDNINKRNDSNNYKVASKNSRSFTNQYFLMVMVTTSMISSIILFYLSNPSREISLLHKEIRDQYNTISLLKKEINSKSKTGPPIIIMQSEENFWFATGSTVVPENLKSYIIEDLVKKIDDLSKIYEFNTIEVVGHTDGQPINSKIGNLDQLVEDVVANKVPIQSLKPASNVDLALIRALAIVKIFKDVQAKGDRLQKINPEKGFRAYSAGPLVLSNGTFSKGFSALPDRQRNRIEIRLTQEGEIDILK